MEENIGPLFDLVEGERRKSTGMEQALTIPRKIWLEAAKAIAHTLAEAGPVTIDDVAKRFFERFKVPMNEVLYNASGSVFRTGFKRIGYQKTERAQSHARIIGVWRKE